MKTKRSGAGALPVAVWAATSWSAVASAQCSPAWLAQPSQLALNGSVRSLTVYRGDLVAAGRFTNVGGTPANYIARWDGLHWNALGAGIGCTDCVRVMTVHNDRLVVGGRFGYVGGQEMMNLAQWNGSSWAPVGGGVNWEGAFELASFREWLVVAGDFYIAGILGGPAANVRGIAAWNGTSWNNMEMGTTKMVHALTVWRDRLIAGGSFQEIGSIYAHGRIASWDGTTWSVVPTPHDGGGVRELAVLGDDLFACPGWLTGTGSIVARYDGTTWTPMGINLPSYWGEENEPPSITSFRGAPILALPPAMFQPGPGMYRWTGTTWEVLGGGVDNQVLSVAVRGYRLWAGGHFNTVGGGISSPRLARYGCRCYPDCDNSGDLTAADFACFQAQFVLGDPYVDCDLNGALTVADFACFQGRFVSDCP